MNAMRVFLSIFFVTTFLFFPLVLSSAQSEEGDIEFAGIELELILALINAFIALFLFVLAFVAYSRDRRTRILYVSLAFFLFSMKNFLVSSELFFSEVAWFDPLTILAEFVAMLLFFYGALKK
ncbi:MAG: hypothetical protein AABX53_01290 [Nanoarchaeota archaeon]